MATKKTSQAQHESNGMPFPGLPGMEMFRGMMQAQSERFEKLFTDIERLEQERHERTLSALEDMTQLMKSTLHYQQQLGDQVRRASLEAARKSLEMTTSV
ncbi:MAG: hypothetical protein RLO52_43460 [Sandaracinaceae bacterium]|nr:MAG: hypothetical protein EVA89_16255 [Sandaracinaceae bacterium]HBQ17578.1 hypothetical protein [Myxococcales bacterium]